jgi:hypothetical protein
MKKIRNQSKNDDIFEEFNFFGMEPPKEIEEVDIQPKKDNDAFEYIKSVSKTKVDLIKNAEIPEEAEKKYVPFLTNKSFSFHIDTIMHANEMNSKHWLFKDAQYRYYLSALRPRDRRSAWFKASKDETLDNIQEFYQCNRTVAKQHIKVLSKENIELINNKVSKGRKIP